ncbi:hypothetical protein, partial [Saccharopolyspora sp. NPDC050642]|uniref:hypothetical protein n=1 Tax=Saccharopolyspora sp. NPDC050642 TaxID=3157099 RepID=UPI0033C8EBB9
MLVARLVLALARQHGIPTTTRTTGIALTGGTGGDSRWDGGSAGQRPQPRPTIAAAAAATAGLAAGVVRVAAVAGLAATAAGIAAIAGLAAGVVRILTAAVAGLAAATAGLAATATELAAGVVCVLVAAVAAISILIARDMLVGFLVQHQPAQTR